MFVGLSSKALEIMNYKYIYPFISYRVQLFSFTYHFVVRHLVYVYELVTGVLF